MQLLKFIVTTSFRGTIYQQMFGTAMGSLVSHVIANLFMEWLEQHSHSTNNLQTEIMEDISGLCDGSCEERMRTRTDRASQTHTYQYLNFTSHHPLHQNLGVIKTLLDRCDNIVSEPEDREKEVEHITKTLERCGCPIWTIKKVKEQQSQKEKNKEKNTEKSKGMVTLPNATSKIYTADFKAP